MSDQSREQAMEAMKDGLRKLGVSEEEIASATDPSLPPEEAQRRFQAAIDGRIRAKLAGIGMTEAEQAAVLDSSGTEAEQQARREQALGAMAARELSKPEVIGKLAEQAASGALKELDRRARQRAMIRVAAVVVILAGAGGFWLTRQSPCQKLAGNAELLSGLFGQPVTLSQHFTSKYSCSIYADDAKRHQVLRLEVQRGRGWNRWSDDLHRRAYASVEPLQLGDQAELGLAPEGVKAPEIKLEDLQAQARAGVRDPMGEALDKLPPESNMLIVRAGDNALLMQVHGSAEVTRKVIDALIAPHLDVVRSASYK